MEISGLKTRSCFERYHIVSLADIQETGQKMDKWVVGQFKLTHYRQMDEAQRSMEIQEAGGQGHQGR